MESAFSAAASCRVASGTGSLSSVPAASGSGVKDGRVVFGWQATPSPAPIAIRKTVALTLVLVRRRAGGVRVGLGRGRIDMGRRRISRAACHFGLLRPVVFVRCLRVVVVTFTPLVQLFLEHLGG